MFLCCWLERYRKSFDFVFDSLIQFDTIFLVSLQAIIAIGHVTKGHLEKTVNSSVIARTRAHAIHKMANARAVPAGLVNFVKRNAASEHLDLIVHKNVIAISTIQSHAMPLMDDVYAKIHGQVSTHQNYLDKQKFNNFNLINNNSVVKNKYAMSNIISFNA